MFKHLFKLIWNKKKQNFLLMSEMLVSFLVIFAVFTLMVYYYNNYKKPIGLDYQNLWVVNYNNTYQTNNTDSLNIYYQNLTQTIKSLPQVKEVSYCSDNVPFSQNQWTGDVHYKKAAINSDNYTADDNYRNTLNMHLLEGRWFNKADAVAKTQPVIINDDLKEKLFGNEEAIGKLVGSEEGKFNLRVIGVVQGLKAKGDYSPARAAIYKRTDTGSYRWLAKIMIKVTPDADAAFEGRLDKMLSNYMKKSNIEIEHMPNKLKSTNLFSIVPMIVTLIVACFLVINVALGLFGVLWYNINKRRGRDRFAESYWSFGTVSIITISFRVTYTCNIIIDTRHILRCAISAIKCIQPAGEYLYSGDDTVYYLYLFAGIYLLVISR